MILPYSSAIFPFIVTLKTSNSVLEIVIPPPLFLTKLSENKQEDILTVSTAKFTYKGEKSV